MWNKDGYFSKLKHICYCMCMHGILLSSSSSMRLRGFPYSPNAWKGIIMISVILFSQVEARKQTQLRYSVKEEEQSGTEIGNIKADSKIASKYLDPEVQSRLRFLFLGKSPANFAIDAVSGILSVSGRLDRETRCAERERCDVELHIAIQPADYHEIIKVIVKILDKNDNSPTFGRSKIDLGILESAPMNTVLVIPTAKDNDSPKFGIRRYELLPKEQTTFELQISPKLDGSTDLKLVLKSHLNREETPRYQFRLLAWDGGSPSKSGAMDIFVDIEDTNDNPPLFLNSTYYVTVPETTPVGSSILTVEAIDRDAGPNGKIEYTLSPFTDDTYGDVFVVDIDGGILGIKQKLDHESMDLYTLTIVARDKGPGSIPVECTVVVTVLDENDHAPQITVSTLVVDNTENVARIQEGEKNGTFVALISVEDLDSGNNGQVNCSLDGSHFRLVPVYEAGYKIETSVVLDRERRDEYTIQLRCWDFGERPQRSVKTITVIVEDVNDHDPMFLQQTYKASIIENNYEGHFVVQVNATDEDAGHNAELHYSLPDDVTYKFQIDEFTGRITAKASFDYENFRKEEFRVSVRDSGNPARSATTLVTVTVENVNDEPPVFESDIYQFGVTEGEAPHTRVGQVRARDADGDQFGGFTYSLEGNPLDLARFDMDPETGWITTLEVLDREDKAVYVLTARATDSAAPRTLSTTSKVNIGIGDVNDNQPEWLYPTPQNNTRYISNKVPKSYIIATLKAEEKDWNQKILYGIMSGNEEGYFICDSKKGTIRAAKPLSDISYQFYKLHVEARDSGTPPLSASSILNVVVNKNVSFPLDPEPLAPFLGTNFIIVMTLTCSCVLLTVILITVIIIIRRKERTKKQRKYNCRMEALLKLQGAKEPCLAGSESPARNLTMSKSRSSSADESCSECSEKSKQHDTYIALDSGSNASPYRSSERQCVKFASPPDRYITKPSRTLDRRNEVEVHRFLDTLEEKDHESVHSGDGSNTDSGRGPSEEGETNKHLRDNHSDMFRQGSALRPSTSMSRQFCTQSATLPSVGTSSRPQVTFNLEPLQPRFQTFGAPPPPPQRAPQHNGASTVNGDVTRAANQNGGNVTSHTHFARQPPSILQTRTQGPQYYTLNSKTKDTTI